MERQPRLRRPSESRHVFSPRTRELVSAQNRPTSPKTKQNAPQAAIPQDLQDVPFLSKTLCNGFMNHPEIYDGLCREFSSSWSCHGAFQARVLLWGPQGCGKRQLGTYFAQQFAIPDKRKILWVEGQSPVTFIRDFRFAYQLVVGAALPSGLSMTSQLHRIYKALSQTSTKWFMVVFDLHSDLQCASLNETGIDLTYFLPQGQILITYSPKLLAVNKSAHAFDYLPSEIKSKLINRIVQIMSCGSPFLSKFAQQWGIVDFNQISAEPDRKNTISENLLSLSIGFATIRMGQLSFEEYCRMFDFKTRVNNTKRPRAGSPAHILFNLTHAMELFLEFLDDIHQDASYLLLSLLPVTSNDVPVRLLKKLRLWDGKETELEDSLEFLCALGIISIKTLPDTQRFVSISRAVHSWLKSRYRTSRNDGYEDCRSLIKQWTKVLDHDLPEMQHESHRHKYWLLLHLAQSVAKNAELIDWHATPIVSLLRKIATFMREFSITPLEANRMLARALFLTSDFVVRDPNFDVKLERLKLHRERSKICALIADYAQARQEYNYAERCLAAMENSADVAKALPFNLDDDLIELSLRQGSHSVARGLIDQALARTEELTPERTAKLHYWVVCCTNDDSIPAIVDALQHSHLTMSYWHSLPEEQRWSGKCFNMVAWVDAHTDLLLQMDRSKGALIFMPKLLTHYIRNCPPTNESIWRVAYCMVREYITIMELESAETTACRALSLCDFDEMEGIPLAWALSMLHVLGAAFARMGRYVEAEAIFRKCLIAIEEKHPPCVNGQGKFSSPNLWLELCHTLLVQGKHQLAETARSLAVQRGVESLKADDWHRLAREPQNALLRVYERVLRAAQDRLAGIYNLDDNLIGSVRPRTYSIAIDVLGDPIDRLGRGMAEVTTDIIPTKKFLGYNSEVLELLGYHPRPWATESTNSSDKSDPDWSAVFEASIRFVGDPDQQIMNRYWRDCECRRRRNRSSSIDVGTCFRGLRVRQADVPVRTNSKTSMLHNQPLITQYFKQRKKYSDDVCGVDCPCVEANAEGEVFTQHIESKILYTYKSRNVAEDETRQMLYRRKLRQFRYRYGARPAIPYGMSFHHRWRKPEGPIEGFDTINDDGQGESNKNKRKDKNNKKSRNKTNTKAKTKNDNNQKQHEIFWAPDFVLVGDAEANFGYFGQDENYIFTSPAMRLRCHGSRNGLPDLPNIIVTSYRLGEEVRANHDLFNTPSRKQWLQTNILDYVTRSRDSSDTEDDEGEADPKKSEEKEERRKRDLINGVPPRHRLRRLQERKHTQQKQRRRSNKKNKNKNPETEATEATEATSSSSSSSPSHNQKHSRSASVPPSRSRARSRPRSHSTSSSNSESDSQDDGDRDRDDTNTSPRYCHHPSSRRSRSRSRSNSTSNSGSNSDSTSTSDSDSTSRSRSRSMSPSEQRTLFDRTQKPTENLKLFDITSLHSTGSIFGVPIEMKKRRKKEEKARWRRRRSSSGGIGPSASTSGAGSGSGSGGGGGGGGGDDGGDDSGIGGGSDTVT